MATQCKLYRNSPQPIPPSTWTLLTFEKAIRDDRHMQRGLSVIMPPFDGDFIWARNMRWASISVAEGDLRERQFMARFIRDPHGERDDTGASDQADSPGRDWATNVWLFFGRTGEPVGVEVWHDHDEPVDIEHAQFSATTWDY